VRAALAIAARDLRASYVSAFGLGCSAGFAALAGVLLVIDLRSNQARLDSWFGFLFVALGLLAALLTMRALAEEDRAGSLELLLTGPVRAWEVVVGKLLGVAGALAVAVATTLVCPLLVASMGNPDAGPIVTGYIGVALVGLAFIAVGLAVSSSTANPIVAAAGTVAALAALWLGGVIGGGLTGRPKVVLEYLSPSSHVTGFMRGTVSLVDVTYFASLLVAGVTGAVGVMRSRR